jgi:glycosyltransferase involved in cell wall biosynthesis
MSALPLVSVLMPVYNGEKYLRPAIDSILNQSFTDYEFIIINDGSTDSSEEIILSYTDPRIRYVKNEKNIKLIATLNKGLDLCRGEFIARMDADDIAYPARFEKQVKFMSANPGYGLCGTDIDIDSKNKSWVRLGDTEFIHFCFLFHNPICHPTTFIRTEIIRKHKIYFPAEYIHAEEYILWLRILDHSKCINLDEKLLNYRLHEGQVSKVFKADQIQMGHRIRLELFHEIVFFSTEKIRKAHLVIAEMASQELQSVGFEKMSFDFGGWVTVFQLQLWLMLMKFSLLFRKKWDSPYLREFIAKVKEGKKLKIAQEGSFVKRFISKIKTKIKSWA